MSAKAPVDPSAAPPAAVNCTINGRPYSFPKGTRLIDALRQVGHSVPYYCYHPKLEPVGACRVCLVQLETPRGPIVTTACTNLVAEGLKVDTMAERAQLGRKQVLEFLLINHPLDCPVCDKGGECDLQDFTLAYGPGVSGFAEQKIRRRKASDLGPFLVLDQERCIMCQRCVRYEQEVLHEQNLVLKQRGDATVIETGTGEPYGGYFSGNNTELCPVGALTSRTYRFKARPWDVRPLASHCQGCSVACPASVHLRGDRIVRLCMEDEWLCDRGRYGFGHTTAESRLSTPLVRRDGELVPASWEEAVRAVVAGFASGVGVLGGGRLTNEEAHALRALTRGALETEDLDWRTGQQQVASPEACGTSAAAVEDIDRADLVLLVDTSLLEEAPVLEIRLRRAASRGTAVVDLGPVANFRLGRSTRVSCAPEDLPARLDELAERVSAASAPLVVWGGRGPAALAEAIKRLGAPVLIPGEFANARGAQAAGLLPTGKGRDARAMLEAARDGQLGALYMVGANPVRTFPDGALAKAALDAVPFLVVQDLFLTESAERADVVLPALGAMEKDGHVTDLGGMQRPVRRVASGPGGARADGEIFALLAEALGSPLPEGSAEQTPRPVVPSVETGRTAAGEAPPGALRVVLRPRLYAGGGSAAFDPNFAQVREEGVVRLHPDDAAERRLTDGMAVVLRSGVGELAATVRRDRAVARGYAWLAAHGAGGNALGPWATVATQGDAGAVSAS